MNQSSFRHGFAISMRLSPASQILSVREFVSGPVRLTYLGFLASSLVIALGIYLYSVNAIMRDGAVIQDETVRRAALQDETIKLESVALRSDSPAWLAEASAALGFVAVDGVRFLDLDSSLALSFQNRNSDQN
jgi:hypothetical protein